MKIVFDLATPKQVRFFKPMIDRLRAKGCSVSAVTRACTEVDLMRRHLGIRATVLGRYGGASLLGKLVSASNRVRLLAYHFGRLRPDLLVTLSNAESARAAFGLAIPILCFMDLPESDALSRLSLPLATRVCAPWIIPVRDFQKHGVSSRQLFRYRSLDPLAWLQDCEVRESYLHDLGVDRRKVVVVARETEWQSAYARNDLVNDTIKQIARRHPDWQVVNVPRYRAHPFYDMPSLLASCDLFLGGGGTMCIEAAYYGTPVIATRPLQCRYMQWLFDHGLAVAAASVPAAVRKAEAIIAKQAMGKTRQQQAAAIFRRLEFPLDQLVDVSIRTANGA